MTEIKAIECPKCGDTHKTILRPGDFRCASCGTEYFIDDGTVKFGQRPAVFTAEKPPGRSRRWQYVAIVVGLVLTIGGVTFSVYFSSNDSKSSTRQNYSWYSGYGDALYVSADQQPVLMTLGTKIDLGTSNAQADYAAFIDVASNATIKIVPVMDAASLTNHPGGTHFDVRQFANGDIFFIVEKSQLFQVRKADYGLTDVTQSFFKNWPELAIGLAKIEFTYQLYDQGFELIANNGKAYVYHARSRELSNDDTVDRATNAAKWLADTEERDAFSFSMRYDYDFPTLPGQLIAFRYRTYRTWPRDPAFEFHSRGLSYNHWDDPVVLANEGALTHRDFTPGRVYFDYGILYFDKDYVLISYRPTPGKNAVRYVQLLDAKTAAIVFTSRFDVLYAPTECVRYKGGFAIVSLPDTYTLSMSGVLAKHTPFMFEK